MLVRFVRSSWPLVLTAALLLGPAILSALAARPAAADAEPAPLALCFSIDVSSSNWQPSDGYRPSDHGPVYVRAGVVRLVAELLGADTSRPALLAFVTFGGDVAASAPLADVRDDDARREFGRRLDPALRPGGWTNVHRGIGACADLLCAAPPAARLRQVLLSDGRPETPAAGPDAQLAALTPVLATMKARGAVLDTVLYGEAAARHEDPAAGIMRRLAADGGGTAYLAPDGIDLLQVAVAIAAEMDGARVSAGSRSSVSGTLETPFPVPPRLAAISFIVLRSRPDIGVEITDPEGHPVAGGSSAASPYSVVRTLSAPAPRRCRWQVAAVTPAEERRRFSGMGAVEVVLEPAAAREDLITRILAHLPPPGQTVALS